VLYQRLREFGSDVHVFEFDPKKNPCQVSTGGSGLEPLSRIHHEWHQKNGYHEVAKINLGFFWGKDEHLGHLVKDSGFTKDYQANHAMECWMGKDHVFRVDDLERLPDGIKWGGSLSYALVIGGKKDLRKAENYSHAAERHPRTLIGQRDDLTMLLVVVDGRRSTSLGMNADQSADLMIKLGAISAINADGGGSSSMMIRRKDINKRKIELQTVNQPSDGSERSIGSALLVFSKQPDVVPDDPPTPERKVDIILDPGHGGKDPGGGSNRYGLEKDVVLKISLYQEQRFKDHGLRVDFTRDLTRRTDETLDAEVRTNRVKDSGALLCISNHINSIDGDPDRGPDASGAEVIHSIFSDPKWANMIEKELKTVIGFRRTFSKKNDQGLDWYYMHRLTGKVQTVIVEYGFADNHKDAEIIRNNWMDLAEAVVKATVEYIGKTYDGGPERKQPDPAYLYKVQVGSFADPKNAEGLAAELKGKGYPVHIVKEKKGE
jgi:N-acetylmuramoyl-L-alanine amidase